MIPSAHTDFQRGPIPGAFPIARSGRNRYFYGENHIKERRRQVKSASTILHKAFWKDAASNIYYSVKPATNRR